MASDIETRLRKYRHEFEKCLKDPSIVSHLLANSVITDVDAARIKNLYIDRETVKASKELLDAVFTSKAPGKWRSFVDSLESADYPYLKELLSYQNRYDAFSSSRAQKILCLFTPYLEQMIHAHEFVSELKSRGVINAADEELILKTFETKGDIYSTMVLLDRMQCRKSPQDWYYEFLDLLMMKKCEHIVKEMEPDFIENPSSFMPKLDRGEGFKDSNDLGAPQSLTMRQDSPLTSTEYQNDSLQTNLKEINIKPNVTKSLPFDIYRRANRKPGKTDEQDNPEKVDDDDEDSMGSDYDNTSVEAEALASNTAAPFQLREFHLELAENAVLGRNTIICAETGSGKTWVALHIVQQHLQNARN
ncbi:interferon-induced helicase C domain-containing protein 1-like, partial [Ruditapes philippinarum]|uniref:interferon-induced helicase C domain-containing protein 1-like n=1 Tax=Ruditapes philippinarum TaxID=129788 RepID=UPI00295AB1F5